MSVNNFEFPTFISAEADEIITSPTTKPNGARIKLVAPSAYTTRAILHVRFGS